MINSSSITNALVILVVVVIVFGIFFGALLNNTDIANPYRGKAEAAQINAETEWQNELREMDRQYLEAERAAEAEAETARLEEAIRVEREQNNQELAKRAKWDETITSAALFFGKTIAITFCAAMAYILVRLANLVFARLASSAGNSTAPQSQTNHQTWQPLRRPSRNGESVQQLSLAHKSDGSKPRHGENGSHLSQRIAHQKKNGRS